MNRTCSVMRILTVIVVLLVCAGTSAVAMPQDAYFLQDDILYDFATVGIGGAGGTINADGRLTRWSANVVEGWFLIENASNSQPQQDIGTEWQIVLDSGTFKITGGPNGTGPTYWVGDIEYFTLTYKKNDTMYSAAGYDRPSYESEPTEFQTVGIAKLNRTGGTWTDDVLYMEWNGTYNWNFDNEDTEQASFGIGNLQAKLVAVPEPAGVVAMLYGGLGLGVLVVRRKRR